MALSNLEVFKRFAMQTIMGAQAQNTALFNAQTKGGLQLVAGNSLGDYEDSAFFKRLTGLVRRRNAYGTGDVAALTVETLKDTMVRVAAGTPPVDISPSQFKWIDTKPEVVGAMIGKQVAEDTILDMVNTAILGLRSALLNTAALYKDGHTAAMTLNVLNLGAAKFGDRAQALRCWLIHSKVMHDLYGAALTNGQNLFKSDTVNIVQDGFGRVFVVTDSPSLMDNPANPTVYYTFGLAEGACLVRQNDDFVSRVAPVLGKENLLEYYQAEWSYMLGIKGFKWDTANGGASPNDSAIGSAGNWDQYAQSVKDCAGVVISTT